MFYLLKEKYSVKELFGLYVARVAALPYVDEKFASFIRDCKNLRLERFLNFAVEGDFAVDIEFSLERVRKYRVSGGYRFESGDGTESGFVKGKSEKRVNINYLRRTEQSIKHIITADGAFAAENAPCALYSEQVPYSKVSQYCEVHDEEQAKRLCRECSGYDLQGCLGVIASDLQDFSLYEEELKELKKSVCGRERKVKKFFRRKEEDEASISEDAMIKSAEISAVWVNIPEEKDVDVYFYYSYRIKAEYKNKEYYAEILPDGTFVREPQAPYSEEANAGIARARNAFASRRKRASVCAFVSCAALLAMFVLGAALKNIVQAHGLPQAVEWAQKITLMPAVIVDLVLLLFVAVCAIVHSATLKGQMKREGRLEDKKRRSATRGKRTARFIMFYLVALCSYAFVALQVVAWVVVGVNM